jgi:hypothetical protein
MDLCPSSGEGKETPNLLGLHHAELKGGNRKICSKIYGKARKNGTMIPMVVIIFTINLSSKPNPTE